MRLRFRGREVPVSDLIQLAWPIVALVGIGVFVGLAIRFDGLLLGMLRPLHDAQAASAKRMLEADDKITVLQHVEADTSRRLDKMEKQLAILPPVGPRHSDATLKGFR
jgi:hypothetical protein